MADGAAGHAAGAQFVDHRHLAERGVFEQHFDVHQVVWVGAGGDQPVAGGLEALAYVVPQVHELADHLRVDEDHMGARGLLYLVLAVGHHKLAGARAVELGRVGVERPVEADDGTGGGGGAQERFLRIGSDFSPSEGRKLSQPGRTTNPAATQYSGGRRATDSRDGSAT